MRPWGAHRERRCLCYRARVQPSEIHFVCSITEGYDGMAVVRTVDESAGIVEFLVTVDMRGDFEAFLTGLARETPLEAQAPVLVDSAHLVADVRSASCAAAEPDDTGEVGSGTKRA